MWHFSIVWTLCILGILTYHQAQHVGNGEYHLGPAHMGPCDISLYPSPRKCVSPLLPAPCPQRKLWHITGLSNQVMCLSCLGLADRKQCDIFPGPANRWCLVPGLQEDYGIFLAPKTQVMWLYLFPIHRCNCHIYLGPAHRWHNKSHTLNQPIAEILCLLARLRQIGEFTGLLFIKIINATLAYCVKVLNGTESVIAEPSTQVTLCFSYAHLKTLSIVTLPQGWSSLMRFLISNSP